MLTGESTALSPSPRLVHVSLAVLGALAVGVVCVRSLNPDEFNWDVGWLLYGAERIQAGARLYVDVIDENPPLIFWLSVPPVAAAKLFELPVILVFDLLVAALGLLCCWMTHRVLRTAWPESPTAHSAALTGLLLGLVLVAPGRDFGQRENLLFIAMAPYLFAAAARASGRSLPVKFAAAVGLLAAIGLALKPYFLLTWLAVEAAVWMSARDRWRCVENAVIVAVHAAYLAAVLVFAREYLDIIAMMGQFVRAYQESGISQTRITAVVCVGAAALLFALAPANRLDYAMRRVLLAAALGLLATALLQRASFSYRYYPAEAAAVLLAGVIVLGRGLASEASRIVWRERAAALPLACLLAFGAWSGAVLVREARRVIAPGHEQYTVVRLLDRLISEHAYGRPIWVMSTEVWPAFPVVNLSGAGWASRFCCVFIAAGVYTPEEKATIPFPYHDMNRLTELERLQFDAVVEDLRKQPPELLIVDTGSRKQAFGDSDFQFLTYFRRDPRFESIFRQYRMFGQVGKYHVYRRRMFER